MHSQEHDLSDADLDRKRRIHRILIPHIFQHHIHECYTSFLASSDHKVVVLSIQLRMEGHARRKRCPTKFLQCQQTMDTITNALQGLPTVGFAGWDDSMAVLRKAPFAYEQNQSSTGFTEVQALLRESTVHQLAPGAADFLASHGYASLPTPTLYRLPCSTLRSDTDRTGLFVLDKLKTHLSDPHAPQPWRNRQEIWRLVVVGVGVGWGGGSEM